MERVGFADALKQAHQPNQRIRGFLESHKEGKNRFYRPLVEEKDYLAVENRLFLEKMNNRSLTKLVASLYESRSVSEKDLDELAAFIREKTGGGQ